jgi:hypothetical protein
MPVVTTTARRASLAVRACARSAETLAKLSRPALERMLKFLLNEQAALVRGLADEHGLVVARHEESGVHPLLMVDNSLPNFPSNCQSIDFSAESRK